MPSRLVTYLIAAGVVVAALSSWHIWRVRSKVAEVRTQYELTLAQIAASTAKTDAQWRKTEAIWQKLLAKEVQNGQKTRARIDTESIELGDVTRRVQRQRTDRIATAKASTAALPPRERQAADSTLDLLTELLAGAEKREGEVAQFADLAHEAGLTCERLYDATQAGLESQ
ncbi:MAG: DUF2514 family protein [Desulfurellales bacterium]|nr:MAG: DUF2514 family protein [Desulfurellales bacterium]